MWINPLKKKSFLSFFCDLKKQTNKNGIRKKNNLQYYGPSRLTLIDGTQAMAKSLGQCVLGQQRVIFRII
jgi:hypothetical protein